MIPESTIVLIILITSVILFVTELIRIDVTAILIIVSLGLFGILTPSEAFSGFSSEAVLAVMGILIFGIAFERTGAGEIISKIFGGNQKKSLTFLLVTIILSSATLSTMMNNVVVVAILLPSVIKASAVSKIPPSKLLIPLAFGSSFGGMLTLIGTPPNLVVSSQLMQAGLNGFNMFSFFPIGILITLSGLIFFLTVGKRLLPNHPTRSITNSHPTGAELVELYKIENSLYETNITKDCQLAGRTIAQATLGRQYGINIIAVIGSNGIKINPNPEYILGIGDKLIITGDIESLHQAAQDFNIGIKSNSKFSLKEFGYGEVTHIEAVISPRSDLEGKTLRNAKFRDRFGLNVIAIWRGGVTISSGVGNQELQTGDALLIQGLPEKLNLLKDSEDLILLGEPPLNKSNGKSLLSIALFFISILPAIIGIIPISVAALGGALLLILTKCISIEQVYKNLQWKIIFLMAGVIPLGIALQQTGAAELISDLLLKPFPENKPVIMLSVIFLLTVLICITTSNNTAALIMAPIGFSKALSAGLDPAIVMLAVAFASSTSFMTPVAHQSNLLVMGAGSYTKSDYLRIGIPLTIISGIIVIAMLSWMI